jgi:putative SOS response-associated peptidase YedK
LLSTAIKALAPQHPEWQTREPFASILRGDVKAALAGGEPFAFAGLWDSWRKPDGQFLNTFTIITTESNDLVRAIHDRMPVILNDENGLKWLACDGKITNALSLLTPYPSEGMEGYDVSTLVNDPRNDSPACIEPSAMPPSQPLLI